MQNRRYSEIIKGMLITMIAIILLTACGNAGGTTAQGGKKPEHMDAPGKTATVYKANCVSCHGSDLQGRVGPNTNLQKVGARMSEEEIVQQIEQGEGSMQPFKGKLTDEEIAGLAAWLAGKQ